MKALLISMLLMASPCFVWSQLTPDFTANITHACENALVQFQDSSSSINNIKSWSWTVDGTLFSNQSSPAYYFSHAGDYEICLTIEDSLGNTQSICKPNYIKIHRSPIASFSSDQQWTCGLPSTINFTDNSIGTDTNLVRWVWDYGDGVLDSSIQSPSHPYQISGIFDVTLIVRDANGCSNSALASDYIHINNVTATIESNHSDTICQLPVSVNFWPANISGAGNISYQWNFGNGSTANTQMALSYYDSAGTYPIHLILQDSFCTDTIYSPTGVSANVLNADFLIDTVAGCKTLEPTVQALPNNLVTYEFWDFDFENNFETNTSTASYHYQEPGRYNIMHVVSDIYGCVDTVWKTVDVSEPIAKIASDQVSGCIPLTVNFADSSYNKHSLIPITNWDWQLDSTLNSAAQHPSMIYADTGFYPVKLIITDAIGCKDSTTLGIGAGIHSQIYNWSSTPDEICHPYENIIFSMNGSSYIDTILWEFEDMLGTHCILMDTVTTDTICPGLLVNNFLIVSHNGCRDSLRLDTFVINQAIARFDYTCGSLTVNFEADTTNSTQWHWDFGDTTTKTDVDTGFLVSYTFPDYGKYIVTLAVYDSVTGCIDTLEKEIIVLESFNSNIISDDTLCLGDLLYMQDSNHLAELRRWWCSSPDDTILYNPFDTTGLAVAILNQPGTQTIFLKAQTFTGCIDTVQKNIFVSQPQPVIHMTDLTRNCIPLDKKLYVSDSTDASNPIVNYIWSTGHTTDTINFTIINSSINTFEVTVTNHFGCIGSTAFNFQPHWVSSAFSLPDNICLPDSFQLNNMSSSSLPNLQYTWAFGDGDSSTIKNPKHSYSQGNVYNVRLYVRNDSLGCVDSLNQFIIANKLEASWGADSTNSTCPPMTTNFTDSSRILSYSPTGLKWNWHFGDGSTSILEDPSHIYSTPGSYDVTMILSNLVGCTDTLHRDSFILIDGPQGSWHVEDKAACQPLNTLFSAASNNTVSYTWVFGDGNFQINSSNLSTDSIAHLYSYPGEYYPTLILEDTSGCTVPFPGDTITVRPNPIFGISPDTSICQNELVQFQLNMTNPSGNISADWWFPEANPNYSNNTQPTIQFDSAGVFDIYVAVNMESCVDTILYSNYVDVHAVPIASFASSVSDSCVGFNSLFTDHSNPIEDSLQSWQWNFGNGQTSNSPNPPVTSYTAVDSFTATLTVHNSWGCADTTQQIIYARPYPNAYAGKDTSICLNNSLFLNGQGGQIYSWTSSSIIDNPSAAQTFSTPLHTEQYILEVLNEYGCADQDSLGVIVHNLPNIDAGLDQTICNGDTTILTASPNNYTSYEWSANTSCPNCVQTSVNPTLTASYTLIVQDSNSCYNQDSIIVTVLPTTFPKSNDRSICLNDQIQLPQIAGTAHFWKGSQLSCQQCPNPVASPNSTSLYTLSFDLPNGCPAKDTLLVKVFDLSNFSAGQDQDICIGEQANLAPQIPSGIPFEWRSPASLSDSFSLNPTLTTTVSSYAELIIGQDACIQNDYVSIFVHNPSPTTSLDIDVCEGDTTQLQVWTDAPQIEWLSTFGFLDSSAQQFPSPSIQIDQSHQYAVVGQHQYCPNDTAYANIIVHPKPIVELGEDMPVLKTQMVQFTPITNNKITNWEWSPANLLDCADCPNPIYEATQDQTFILQATDNWGCTTSDSIAVGLYPPCYVDLITVPTAFSPNGDGVNDQIHPYSIGNKVDFIKKFSIYNRWGILVFESNSLQEGWNGQYKGLEADIGVYAYYVVYPCPLGGEDVIITGEFTLIR